MPPAHLKKGSPAAKAYMAHLRSLRGKGCHARGRRAGKNLVGGILGPMALLGPGLKIGKWIGKKIMGAIKKKKEGQTSGGNKIANEVLKRAKLAALIARAQAASKGGALPIPDESVFNKPPYRVPLSRPSPGKKDTWKAPDPVAIKKWVEEYAKRHNPQKPAVDERKPYRREIPGGLISTKEDLEKIRNMFKSKN